MDNTAKEEKGMEGSEIRGNVERNEEGRECTIDGEISRDGKGLENAPSESKKPPREIPQNLSPSGIDRNQLNYQEHE